MKREYFVIYQNRGEKINDILNTFELIMLLILCRFNNRTYVLKIERNDFCEQENYVYDF